MEFEELDSQQNQAAQYLLEFAGVEPTNENVRHYLAWEILSFTEDANGRYAWYMDENGTEACLNVDTLEEMETSEFE